MFVFIMLKRDFSNLLLNDFLNLHHHYSQTNCVFDIFILILKESGVTSGAPISGTDSLNSL